MSLGASFADEPVEKPTSQWVSPNGIYTAKVDLIKGPPDVRLTVGQTIPDKIIIGDTEQFDSAGVHPLSPQFIGIWSPTGDRFCLFTGRDIENITGKLVALQTRAPFFSGEKVLPQFMLVKTFSPIYENQAKIDKVNHFLSKFCTGSNSIQYSTNGQFTSAHWDGVDKLAATYELIASVYNLKDGKAKDVIDYKAQWDTSFRMTLDGFSIIGEGPVSVQKTTRQPKETCKVETPKEL